MKAEPCDFPPSSSLDPAFLNAADYRDSYQAMLSLDRPSPVDLFFAVFGHEPLWMKGILIARNIAVAPFGLKRPTTDQVLTVERKAHYALGDTIGRWPIFALNETELIAGRDNGHMDFRLSLLKVPMPGGDCVVVSTVCKTHNRFGRFYLACVVPFHKLGVMWLINNAHSTGRL